MRLRLFRAASMAEAMRQIRAELGPDALILNNRRTGEGVEVTAALEDEPIAAMPAAPSVPAPSSPVLDPALAWHHVPADLAAFLSAAPLAEQLPRAFRFAASLDDPNRILLLVGAPGAGKTLTIAKLATRCVMRGGAPLVITADGKRAGATEQLAAFTRLLGIDLIVANNAVSLARAMARRAPGNPVLIDAPGGDPFDPAHVEATQALAAASGADMLLIQPTGLDAEEAAELGAAWREAGAALLLPTRLDFSRRLGGILACAQAGRLAFTEAGISASVADGLAPFAPSDLAALLIAGKQARYPSRKEAA